MPSYKNEVTLNEKDTLTDLLFASKNLMKLYALVITETVSSGLKKTLLTQFNDLSKDQLAVFFLMTERGYYQTQSAEKEAKKEFLDKFTCAEINLC